MEESIMAARRAASLAHSPDASHSAVASLPGTRTYLIKSRTETWDDAIYRTASLVSWAMFPLMDRMQHQVLPAQAGGPLRPR